MQPPRPGLRDTLKVFRAWLRALPRPFLFAGGAVVLMGAAAGGFAGYTTHDYTMNNPPLFPPRHTPRGGGAPRAGGPGAPPPPCHTSGDPRWRQVAETAGHQVHAERRQIECVLCHSQAVHHIQPSTAVCAKCHQAQSIGARAIKIPQMAEFHCVDCHQFLRLSSPLRPTRQTCLGCHQALPPKKTVGFPPPGAHTTLTCSTSHKPPEKAQPARP